MDKFTAMQAFVRVVEAGTFTKASDSMGMPKATVTRLIQNLEKELDTKLLNRTTRKVTVTADGAAYFERVGRLLGDVQELESSMSRAKASPRGRLKIDIPGSLGSTVIIPALPDFYARYPDIQIELGVSDRPVDIIADNVDCVVRGGELVDQSLVARRVGELHLMTCATPAYLRRHGTPTHPSELAHGHTLVRYMSPRTGRLFPIEMYKDGESFEVTGHHMLALNDSASGVAAALAGLGVTHTLSLLVQGHISTGALVPLFAGWCSESPPIHVVYPPNRHLSNKVRVFVDWVAELFASHDLMQRKCSLPRPVTALLEPA
ncbi:MAG TPA: LysR family transcriptional regulator [Polaromonas sp.]|uniref:LysR substrate-binding domain-containing protein n=1 Tax=Polaromonas sp. TaxID=1869339 RepID=UPI002D4B5F8A|nr:LysR family transcriptional regulator [Polaromonas sp.]HYW56975.1 LysR family transcriptional regulator [Polaromonas sp.]